jgi:hypothetical protein
MGPIVMKKNITGGIFTLLLFSGAAIAYGFGYIKLDSRSEAVRGEVSSVINTPKTNHIPRQQEMIDGFPLVRTSASFMFPDNIDDLIAKSEVIVIGKTDRSVAQAIQTIPRNSDGWVFGAFSEVPFKVTKVFKGDKDLKEIRLGQAAALIEEKGRSYIQAIDDYIPMEPNQKYLLFLQKGMSGTPGENLYFSTGLIFGQHNLENNKEEEAFTYPLFKEIRKAVKERFKE